LRDGNARAPDGLWLGYSVDELADRIAALLRSMGADRDWPELVVLFGHGASSVNNPYFAAYNCGACSGRVGAPNARAFAMAANDPAVREALATRGVVIPESTFFVGALYDTTRDEATFFDVERMPARFASGLATFRKRLDEALGRNAVERCRRFDSAPRRISPARALEHVRLRSTSLFEPRPEYNHATNASCIVGRRALTSGLFLDRRAFLSSYDPEHDPTGDVLAELLPAVIPVCAGINLEYFFSRIDPRVYGAGSKLPHNVNGLVGVCNGIEGDLLTGLPTQMTEIHDPLRLLVVVEQSPEIALAAARRSPSIGEVIENEWVRYACIDPTSHEAWMAHRGTMMKLTDLPRPTRRWRSSLDAAREGRGNLPIGFVSCA
ncbi:MAG TPA: putative inorganic carbon transporter subunit DabA, partial [Polyangiaceae bacterium]